MPHSIKPFLLGVVCSLLLGAVILFGMDNDFLRSLTVSRNARQTETAPISTYPPISPDAVKIQPLPPLLISSGNIKFEGKKEYPQKIVGNYARNITVVRFKATGENAHKSFIKVIWMDGTYEIIPPDTTNLQLSTAKNAKQIIISGYAMHERRIFKDSSRPGTLEWDIRYESVL